MRVLVVYAHPNPHSYVAALHRVVVDTLGARGHAVDDLDLYAEGFEPVLSREERERYLDLSRNREAAAPYVERVLAAEAMVLVFPVWNFGYPAIMKGFFDRVNMPGVFFHLTNGTWSPALQNIRRLGAVATYGATPLRALLAGDPPRTAVKRHLRSMIHRKAPVRYLAHYAMNVSTDATRGAFLAKVRTEFGAW